MDRVATAVELMNAFAVRTGLASEAPPARYLWTDAFAVRNFLALAQNATEPERPLELALRLIDRVHHCLARHRADDARKGWLSGLAEADAELHPTAGGLRIGKPLPERRADERFDERLEWERDGQYFHYLTQWMQSLDSAARATQDPRLNAWGRELAAVAFTAFGGATRGRLAWKMSIDLTRPLVSSTGQHDALDALVTFAELESTREHLGSPSDRFDLGDALGALERMVADADLSTSDPLGLGGLLTDALRVARLVARGAMPGGRRLLLALLESSGLGLRRFASGFDPAQSAERRLAFREIGLGIGLRAAESLIADRSAAALLGAEVSSRLDAIRPYGALGRTLEAFWTTPAHRESSSWRGHRDINDVMLATLLLHELG